MTDTELSAAIAEAVRGVWPELCVGMRNADEISLDLHEPMLEYDEPDREWSITSPDHEGDAIDIVLSPCWAAAILLHELSTREDGAEATWKLRDLLEQA